VPRRDAAPTRSSRRFWDFLAILEAADRLIDRLRGAMHADEPKEEPAEDAAEDDAEE
jgi:hypothetical protein